MLFEVQAFLAPLLGASRAACHLESHESFSSLEQVAEEWIELFAFVALLIAGALILTILCPYTGIASNIDMAPLALRVALSRMTRLFLLIIRAIDPPRTDTGLCAQRTRPSDDMAFVVFIVMSAIIWYNVATHAIASSSLPRSRRNAISFAMTKTGTAFTLVLSIVVGISSATALMHLRFANAFDIMTGVFIGILASVISELIANTVYGGDRPPTPKDITQVLEAAPCSNITYLCTVSDAPVVVATNVIQRIDNFIPRLVSNILVTLLAIGAMIDEAARFNEEVVFSWRELCPQHWNTTPLIAVVVWLHHIPMFFAAFLLLFGMLVGNLEKSLAAYVLFAAAQAVVWIGSRIDSIIARDPSSPKFVCHKVATYEWIDPGLLFMSYMLGTIVILIRFTHCNDDDDGGGDDDDDDQSERQTLLRRHRRRHRRRSHQENEQQHAVASPWYTTYAIVYMTTLLLLTLISNHVIYGYDDIHVLEVDLLTIVVGVSGALSTLVLFELVEFVAIRIIPPTRLRKWTRQLGFSRIR